MPTSSQSKHYLDREAFTVLCNYAVWFKFYAEVNQITLCNGNRRSKFETNAWLTKQHYSDQILFIMLLDFGYLTSYSIAVGCFQNGVDVNSWDRALLHSAKPSLHANVDCTPLIAAIVSRQAPVVKYLLKVITLSLQG